MQGKLLVRNRSGGAKLLAGLTKRGALRRSCPPAACGRLLLYFAMQNTPPRRTGWRVGRLANTPTLIACVQAGRDGRAVDGWMFPQRTPTRVQAANGGGLTQRSQGGGGRRPPGGMGGVDRPAVAATPPLGVKRAASQHVNHASEDARSEKNQMPASPAISSTASSPGSSTGGLTSVTGTGESRTISCDTEPSTAARRPPPCAVMITASQPLRSTISTSMFAGSPVAVSCVTGSPAACSRDRKSVV